MLALQELIWEWDRYSWLYFTTLRENRSIKKVTLECKAETRMCGSLTERTANVRFVIGMPVVTNRTCAVRHQNVQCQRTAHVRFVGRTIMRGSSRNVRFGLIWCHEPRLFIICNKAYTPKIAIFRVFRPHGTLRTSIGAHITIIPVPKMVLRYSPSLVLSRNI